MRFALEGLAPNATAAVPGPDSLCYESTIACGDLATGQQI
jgi:hypothetical protein